MKRLFAVIFSLVALIFPTQLFAQESKPFHTALQTTVTVSPSSLATIRHDFTITNKTPTTYVSQYGLKISSSELQNITVTSDGQQIKPEIVVLPAGQQAGPGQTSIGITFPDKLVGEGKSRQFSIGFVHPDAAVVSGSVLEVSLPTQTNPEDYDEYEVTIVSPSTFGPPIRTTPSSLSYTTVGNTIHTTFKNGSNGIFALYGSTQLFDLELSYHLENTTGNPGITQIALPPDTSYQQLYYQQLEPKPQKLELDADGNWIATYKVAPNSTTTVFAKATTKLSLEPNNQVPVHKPGKELVSSQEFWQVNDAQIEDIAREHASAEAINEYVVNTLSYNTKRALNPEIDRLGAVEALSTPDLAVCTEFTDVFVTLARAANIPARRMTGYAYTQNNEIRPLSLVDDVLHAWPEYYDDQKNQWTPIDPTWENTTGGVDYFNQRDLNHIVFAINGHNSVTPYPAGSYKTDQTENKTVTVSFGTSFPETLFEVEYQLIPRKMLGINLPGLYDLEVTNTTGKAWYNLPIELQTVHSRVLNTKQSGTVPTLLPFQTLTIPIHVESTQGLFRSDTITVEINHANQQFNITSGPAITGILNRPHVLVAMAGVGIVLTLGTGSLLVLRRRRQRSVRR